MYVSFGKRVCDIVVGLVALPFVLLIIAVLAPFIHFEDKGPVFYNAPRVGKDGRDFKMYKLRSMRVNAPDLIMEDGSTYNVLKGDMSVVGPRPDLRRETELYEGEEGLKLTVKPGITGYAAVYGRNSLPWHDRLALDVHYVRNVSFPLDVKVFFKTFSAVFNQEGVFVEDGSEK